jgi:hypothetical protein
MISYYVVIILINFLRLIISPIQLFPDVSISPNITNAFVTAGSWIAIVQQFLPLTVIALFSIILVFVGIETAIFSYKFAKWMYQKIPGIN